jgi:hypothetical protein
MTDVTFLLGSSVIAVLCVQVLKDLLGKVENRWGSLISQLTLLVVSFGIAGFGVLFNRLPPEIINTTVLIFASAMAIYEVCFKALYQKAIKGIK